MKIFTYTALILFLSIKTYAQMENQRWKQLSSDSKDKIWYDESFLDTIKTAEFNVWILQMYNPPLTFEEITGKVYRSKIQYAVNLKMMKYGMLKAVYYGINNKLLYDFDYHIDSYPDQIKYTYPVSDNKIILKVIDHIKEKFTRGPKENQ